MSLEPLSGILMDIYNSHSMTMPNESALARARQVALVDEGTGVARLSRAGRKRLKAVLNHNGLRPSFVRHIRHIDQLFEMEYQMLVEIYLEEMSKVKDGAQRLSDAAAIRELERDLNRLRSTV